MAVKKVAPKEIGKKECLDFYNELIKEIKRGKFFTEKKDRRYDEPNKKESVFDCPRGLVRLMISINSIIDWREGLKVKATRIEWLVRVFISGVRFNIICPSAEQFLNYVQEKIYRESIKPSIGDGYWWSTNPNKKEGKLNFKKYKPRKVARDIVKRIKDMIIVFDGVKEEVIKAVKRIDFSVSKIVDKEKQMINETLSAFR